MDHVWDGFYTGLKRLSRFHSVVQSQKDYKVDFTGTVPNGLRWQLQGALPTESITVQYGYTKPQSVKVVDKDGNEIKPFVAKTQTDKVILDSHPCGTNIYNLEDRRITIKLTGEDNCRLDVTIINSIVATVRYSVTVEEFFAQNGPTKFVDMVAALLKINPASIRVVDVTSGSSIITVGIPSTHQGSGDSTLAAAKAELDGFVNILQQAKESGQMDLLNARILDSSFTVALQNPEGAENSTISTVTSGGSIVVIIIACTVAGVAILVGAYFAHLRYRKRRSTHLKVMDSSKLPTVSPTSKITETCSNMQENPLMHSQTMGLSITPSSSPIQTADRNLLSEKIPEDDH